MASRMTCGTRATANKEPTRVKSSESTSLSSNGKRWSDVIPDGPGAAPRRALRKHVRNSIGSNSNCSASSACWTSRLNPSLGTGGLRSGSERALNVANVRGAREDPSNSCLAVDTSPTCTEDMARAALLASSSSSWARRLRRTSPMKLHSR